MKVYTKTGDKGKTSLLGGTRVSKAHARINAYGTVDELNSFIGLVRDQKVNESRQEELINIQNKLFTVGSHLASDPEKSKATIPDLLQEDVDTLEQKIDEMEGHLAPMKNFILPGGHQSVSYCHVARCVCRRAERLVIGLSEDTPVADIIVQYLNRLSDYLFVLSRKMSAELDAEETPWLPNKKR